MRSIQQVQRREKHSLNYAFQPKENFDAILARENRRRFKKQYKEMIKRKHEDFQKKQAEKSREPKLKSVKRNWKIKAESHAPVHNRVTRNRQIQNHHNGKKSFDHHYYHGTNDSKDTVSKASKVGVLSMAGSSIANRKNHELLEQEAKLVEEYFRNYKQPKKTAKKSYTRKNLQNNSYSPVRKQKHSLKNASYSAQKSAQLLDEDERILLIAKLDKRKQDIWGQIQKLPICNRSSGVLLKEKELYDELDKVSSEAMMLYSEKIYVA
ncbi:unnamed protein product [Moneuplotes crassus]|uniref:Uncharacterized protein n=1 Tax=Euplotes crassus TaxID=5936 RepID=A0AAD2D059_EUPCR|nr:unnamed protein product [Moneuplotes crassus]